MLFVFLIATSATIAILSPALPAWFPWVALISLALVFVGSSVRDYSRKAELADEVKAIRESWRATHR